MPQPSVVGPIARLKQAIESRLAASGRGMAAVRPPSKPRATRPRGQGRVLSHRALAGRVYLATLVVAVVLLPYSRITVDGAVIDLTFVLAAVALVVAYAIYSALLRRALQRYSYGWYARHHTGHILPDGRITCRHCQGRRVGQQELHRVGYLAQMCIDCGETLFFRPERRKRRRAQRTETTAADGTAAARPDSADRRRREPFA